MLNQLKFYSPNILIYSMNLSSFFSIVVRFLIIYNFILVFLFSIYLENLMEINLFYSKTLEIFFLGTGLILIILAYFIFLYTKLKVYTSQSIYVNIGD